MYQVKFYSSYCYWHYDVQSYWYTPRIRIVLSVRPLWLELSCTRRTPESNRLRLWFFKDNIEQAVTSGRCTQFPWAWCSFQKEETIFPLRCTSFVDENKHSVSRQLFTRNNALSKKYKVKDKASKDREYSFCRSDQTFLMQRDPGGNRY